MQASLKGRDAAFARALREQVEKTGGYFEGDVAMVKSESGLDAFEAEVKLAREASATVARTVFTGGRRYEIFKTMEDFRRFTTGAEHSLTLAEPVLRKHQVKLAIENHKDHTAPELAALLRKFSSEWIGALVDTGNNLALLEEPHEAVAALAPFALSVHLKDMALQPHADGFLLSEVIFSTGFLDLARMIRTLRQANPRLVFNVEMATRDPLLVPCKTEAYWATFPARDEAKLMAALNRVAQHPPKVPPPRTSGLPTDAVLAAEESNNRLCLSARASLGL